MQYSPEEKTLIIKDTEDFWKIILPVQFLQSDAIVYFEDIGG